MNMYHNMYFYFSNTGSIFKCVLIQFRERFCFQRWAHICCLFSHYLPLDSIDKPFFFFPPLQGYMSWPWNYIIFFSLNLESLPSVPSWLTPQKTRYDFFPQILSSICSSSISLYGCFCYSIFHCCIRPRVLLRGKMNNWDSFKQAPEHSAQLIQAAALLGRAIGPTKQ